MSLFRSAWLSLGRGSCTSVEQNHRHTGGGGGGGVGGGGGGGGRGEAWENSGKSGREVGQKHVLSYSMSSVGRSCTVNED